MKKRILCLIAALVMLVSASAWAEMPDPLERVRLSGQKLAGISPDTQSSYLYRVLVSAPIEGSDLRALLTVGEYSRSAIELDHFYDQLRVDVILEKSIVNTAVCENREDGFSRRITLYGENPAKMDGSRLSLPMDQEDAEVLWNNLYIRSGDFLIPAVMMDQIYYQDIAIISEENQTDIFVLYPSLGETVGDLYVRTVDTDGRMELTAYDGESNYARVMAKRFATPEPTATPTVEPTATPTVVPTATPTIEPTATPTVEPTATPTVEPTATPTMEPTATPTVEPTATPTVEPTATPTVEPTATPTVEPTATPTVVPTATPTVEPTATPTVEPTATPTIVPTATPTMAPTATPTMVPTAVPTAAPTAVPVIEEDEDDQHLIALFSGMGKAEMMIFAGLMAILFALVTICKALNRRKLYKRSATNLIDETTLAPNRSNRRR